MNYWENANHSWSKDSLRYINTSTQKTQDLFYYIQEIGYFKASKPYFTERANLPSFLIKYTLSGTGQLNYHEKNYQLKAGDLFFIDCRDYQYYKTISEDPWEMDWIHINGANSQAFYQEFTKNGSPIFTTAQKTVHQNPIHLLMQDLLHLQKEPNSKTPFQASIVIHELLNEIILQKYQLDFSDEDIPAYILEVKNFLDEHFRRPLTLDELAKNFHINKFQITKDYSKYMGSPPIDYLLSKKVSYAKDLLRYTKLSVKQISLEIGIENTAYFSRLFKNKTGLSPSQYRRLEIGG